MKSIEERLNLLKAKREAGGRMTVMILGLGSVGTYLLNYLLNENDERMQIVVVGRNRDKMETDVNIARVSSLIRRKCRTKISIEDRVDLENTERICECLKKYRPDFIVNTSRVYSGLKYGSISWNHVRAYGIWAPLAMKYIRNIMKACDLVNTDAVSVNASYPDVTIPWMKSAGQAYADFGSGNFNHLIPRIKYAVAEFLGAEDFWNIRVALATSHFHDVVISREGHAEGMKQLLKVYYREKEIFLDQNEIFARCGIRMPVDTKRNQMNASSNFDIVTTLIRALDGEGRECFFSPGAFGNPGGYPVVIDGSGDEVTAGIDESDFSMEEMEKANRQSLYLDGIEGIREGVLSYTDELREKTKKAFGVNLPKRVSYGQIDDAAEFLIHEIIQRVSIS